MITDSTPPIKETTCTPISNFDETRGLTVSEDASFVTAIETSTSLEQFSTGTADTEHGEGSDNEESCILSVKSSSNSMTVSSTSSALSEDKSQSISSDMSNVSQGDELTESESSASGSLPNASLNDSPSCLEAESVCVKGNTSMQSTVQSNTSPSCSDPNPHNSSSESLLLNVEEKNETSPKNFSSVDLTDSEESVVENIESDSCIGSSPCNASLSSPEVQFVAIEGNTSMQSTVSAVQSITSSSCSDPNLSESLSLNVEEKDEASPKNLSSIDSTDSEESVVENIESDSCIGSSPCNTSLSSPKGKSVVIEGNTSMQSTVSAVQSITSPSCSDSNPHNNSSDSLTSNVDEENDSPKRVSVVDLADSDREDSTIEKTDGSLSNSSSSPGCTQNLGASSPDDEQPAMNKFTSEQGVSSGEKQFKVGYQRKKVMRQYYEIEVCMSQYIIITCISRWR